MIITNDEKEKRTVYMTMSYIGSALIVIISFGIGMVYYRKKQNKVFDKGMQVTTHKYHIMSILIYVVLIPALFVIAWLLGWMSSNK
jgi:membrane protein YqaA with SNARE-associated domain